MSNYGKFKFNRLLIQFKFLLARGYMWCQLPTLALAGAAVLAPYVQQYYPISMWQLALIAFGIFMFVGFLDWWMGLLQAESSYQTEKNPLLIGMLKKRREGKE